MNDVSETKYGLRSDPHNEHRIYYSCAWWHLPDDDGSGWYAVERPLLLAARSRPQDYPGHRYMTKEMREAYESYCAEVRTNEFIENLDARLTQQSPTFRPCGYSGPHRCPCTEVRAIDDGATSCILPKIREFFRQIDTVELVPVKWRGLWVRYNRAANWIE